MKKVFKLINPRYKIFFSIVIWLGLFAAIIFQSFNQYQKLLENHLWVTQALDVQDMSNNLMANIMDGSSALRGYLLTKEKHFLEPYELLTSTLPKQYKTLQELTDDNSIQQKNLTQLKPLIEQRISFTQLQLDNALQSPLKTRELLNKSQDINEKIKTIFIKINSEEARLLTERENQVKRYAWSSLIWNIGILVVLFSIASLLAFSLFRELQHRLQFIDRLSLLNVELESKNDNLKTANLAIQEADRLKTEFLSAMSHELRTPLNSIIGFTGILRMGIAGELNDEQAKQLGMVNESAQHLLHLISDLLDLSRIESGRAELASEEFDLLEVVHEVLALISPLADKKSLKLRNDCGDKSIILITDRRKVFQVLLNLVSNAIKFSDQGEITVSCHQVGETWRITVKDHGIGIKPESIGMLFQAFRQVDGSAKRLYEGTGLGLFLSKRLLEMMGGDINVKSEYGKGSEFYFSLPLTSTYVREVQ